LRVTDIVGVRARQRDLSPGAQEFTMEGTRVWAPAAALARANQNERKLFISFFISLSFPPSTAVRPVLRQPEFRRSVISRHGGVDF